MICDDKYQKIFKLGKVSFFFVLFKDLLYSVRRFFDIQILPEKVTKPNIPANIGPRIENTPACRSLNIGIMENILSKVFFGVVKKLYSSS